MNNKIKKVTKRNVWHILETYDDRPVPIVIKAIIFALFELKNNESNRVE